MRKISVLGLFTAALVQFFGCTHEEESVEQFDLRLIPASADGEIGAWKRSGAEKGGRNYLKIVDKEGNVHARVVDDFGAELEDDSLVHVPEDPISFALRQVIDDRSYSGRIPVRIVFHEEDEADVLPSYGEAFGSTIESSRKGLRLNGVSATLADLELLRAEELKRLEAFWTKRRAHRAFQLRTLAERQAWKLSEKQIDEWSDGFSSFETALTAEEIVRLPLDNKDIVSAVDLYQEGTDDTLATAMVATSANPGALQLADSQGAGIGVWLTEEGCPPNGFLRNYTRVSGSDTAHSRNTTSILRAVSPASWLYCAGGAVLPSTSQLSGIAGNPSIRIISRSNSARTDNYDTTDRDWDNFIYNNYILVVNSAGNRGNSAVVGAPAHGLNVLTVGNYDDATYTISPGSSGGDPKNTKNRKPELSAPGVRINAGGSVMSGTSQATPHVAGLLADALQAHPHLVLRSYLLKARAIASATDYVAGGVNAVGEGGYDYISGYWSYQDWWWWGSGENFAYWDSTDAYPNNGSIDAEVYLHKGQNVRVVVAWATRGTYTYNHRSDVHPIGVDLDLSVYNPNGAFVGSSMSWDNPYEIVNFVVSVTGTHRIRITRFANRDSSNRTAIGLTVNW